MRISKIEKIFKQEGPSEELSVSVSDVSSRANTILYSERNEIPTENNVFEVNTWFSDDNTNMTENKDKQPTYKDIMSCLNGICARLDSEEKKLCALDQLEKQV